MRIAVAVPARNEAERLPHLLAALARQRGAPHFTLCLFLDNCSDGSADAIAALAATMPYPIVTDCCRAGGPPNAGEARSRAMALALRHAPDGIVMTTDADSRPEADWIAANVAGLAAADVVAGRIVRAVAPGGDMLDRLARYLDRLHDLRRRIDPVPWEGDPTHHWCSAASLALRAATYRAIGGFAPVPSGEDAALCDQAMRLGLRVRRDARARVWTSSRRSGRARGGFASTLAHFDRRDAQPEVSHPDDEVWRFERQAEARRAFADGRLDGLAARLSLPSAEVRAVAAECRNDEAFAARIVGAPAHGMRIVPLGHAELLLDAARQAGLRGAA